MIAQKPSRRSQLLALVILASTACASEDRLHSLSRRDGSFCDQLRYLIVHGTEDFERDGLTGRGVSASAGGRTAAEFLVGTFRPTGAEACYVQRRSSPRYVCTFGDSSALAARELQTRFSSLDRDVNQCLVGSPWPSFVDSRDGSNIRYSKSSSFSDPSFSLYVDAGFLGPSRTIVTQAVAVMVYDRGTVASDVVKRTYYEILPRPPSAKTIALIVDSGRY